MDSHGPIDEADMARMNGFVRAHGGIDVAAGKLSVYSELRVRDGAISGYVKPLFRDVSVGAVDGEEEGTKSLAVGSTNVAVGAAMKILKNQSRGEVATVATISADSTNPSSARGKSSDACCRMPSSRRSCRASTRSEAPSSTSRRAARARIPPPAQSL